MTTLAVIPARYGSVRFPGKPLVELAGKPLVVHVVDRAREARTVDDAIVATDDERILRAVEAHGGRAVMTSPDCPTGTDRIAEAVAQFPEADAIVNVQGDEPLMPPDAIDRAVDALRADPDCAVSTAMIRIAREEDFLSPHVVKVVCDPSGRALYFSRSPIPNLSRIAEKSEDGQSAIRNPQSAVFKHFGLYVYRREALLEFVKMPQTPLEKIEKLEQLRFLENGMTIRVVETTRDSIGVDTPEDLEEARRILVARLRGASNAE
ncbi:3-deoxy-manno-octulosonate cytidylyltransferase [Candidatus Sumerlaeota bacterium]|nr:3-deoxy-manno-octulosonate cytidylyltransferase [Candidatus Sumerlaeota bacterium]